MCGAGCGSARTLARTCALALFTCLFERRTQTWVGVQGHVRSHAHACTVRHACACVPGGSLCTILVLWFWMVVDKRGRNLRSGNTLTVPAPKVLRPQCGHHLSSHYSRCCSVPPKRALQGCEGRWCVRAPLWATRTSACTAPRVGAVHTCSSLRACVFGRPIGRGVCACLCLHSRVSQRECCGVSCASRSQRVRTHGPLCHARAPTRVVVRHSVRCVREGAGCGSARTQARAPSSFTRSF